MSVFFENKVKIIEKHLDKRLNEYNDKIHSNVFSFKVDDNIPTLIEAMKYAVSGGKRIRPLLVILSYESVTGEDITLNSNKDSIENLLDIAIAVECIHAYSLVHDDLPCMDDDMYRRGELTVHAKFGETIAVLTGDALLNFAFETIFNSIKNSGDDMIRYVNAGKIISFCAGSCGMIGGQVLDLYTEYLSNENILTQMVQQKTCALIYGASAAGAIIGGANANAVESIEKFSIHLGIAFQMKDDLFDITQDEKENKITLISKLTKEEAENKIKAETDYAFSAIKNLNTTCDLQYFANYLMTREY